MIIKSLFINTKLNIDEIENLVLKEIDNLNFKDEVYRIKHLQYNNEGVELINNKNISEYIDYVFPDIRSMVLKQKIKKIIFNIINIIF